jgi:hypothetical protein
MDIADVHAGAFADGLQAAKDGNATGIIGRFRTRAFLFRHAIFQAPEWGAKLLFYIAI